MTLTHSRGRMLEKKCGRKRPQPSTIYVCLPQRYTCAPILLSKPKIRMPISFSCEFKCPRLVISVQKVITMNWKIGSRPWEEKIKSSPVSPFLLCRRCRNLRIQQSFQGFLHILFAVLNLLTSRIVHSA